MSEAVSCFKCGNQPDNGLEFITHGHYGSTIFDPMDGSGLAINICDNCLSEGRGSRRVLQFAPHPPKKMKYRLWES